MVTVTEGWQHKGWTAEGNPPVVFICDHSLRIVAEARVARATVQDGLSQPNEATLVIDTTGISDALLEPWAATLVVVVDGVPVWGGTVVKRRAQLGRTSTEVVCREWSAWLDRVWTDATDEWPQQGDPDPVDAAVLAHARYAAAVNRHGSGVVPLPTLRPGTTFAVEGAEFPDQSDETSPQTYLAEIGTLAQQGLEWRHEWEWDEATNQLAVYLRCGVYDAAASATEWVVGLDVADATVSVDSDQQANRVIVRGSDDLKGEAQQAGGTVPLWRVWSFDKIGSVDDAKGQQRLTAMAASILKQAAQPVVTAGDVSAPVLRTDVVAGDMVQLIVPSDYDPRWPEGLSILLRAQSVVWEWSAGSGTTRVTLVTPWENYANVPVMLTGTGEPPVIGKQQDLHSVLHDLGKRLSAVEARRLTIAPGDVAVDHGALQGLSDDDHPQYFNLTRGDARYSQTGHTHPDLGVSDHGDLTGLGDDDHPQYLNNSRGDARYSRTGHNHAGVYDPAGAADSAVSAHEVLFDHAAFATDSELASGLAGKEDAGAAAAEVAAHEGKADPHGQYLTTARGDARYDLLGDALNAVTVHEAQPDPHPGYLTRARGDALYDPLGTAAGAVAAHEAKADPHPDYTSSAELAAGLATKEDKGHAQTLLDGHVSPGTDPHPEYLTPAEGSALYPDKTDTETRLATVEERNDALFNGGLAYCGLVDLSGGPGNYRITALSNFGAQTFDDNGTPVTYSTAPGAFPPTAAPWNARHYFLTAKGGPHALNDGIFTEIDGPDAIPLMRYAPGDWVLSNGAGVAKMGGRTVDLPRPFADLPTAWVLMPYTARSLMAQSIVTESPLGGTVQQELEGIEGDLVDHLVNSTDPHPQYLEPKDWNAVAVEASAVSWNDLVAPGPYYRLMHGQTNPDGPGANSHFFVTVHTYANNNLTQVAVPYLQQNHSGRGLWMRSRYSNVWYPWQRYLDDQHIADTDPHTQYLNNSRGDARYDLAGEALAEVGVHEGKADPHPQYATEQEAVDAAWGSFYVSSASTPGGWVLIELPGTSTIGMYSYNIRTSFYSRHTDLDLKVWGYTYATTSPYWVGRRGTMRFTTGNGFDPSWLQVKMLAKGTGASAQWAIAIGGDPAIQWQYSRVMIDVDRVGWNWTSGLTAAPPTMSHVADIPAEWTSQLDATVDVLTTKAELDAGLDVMGAYVDQAVANANYLPLAGGTLTGSLTALGTLQVNSVTNPLAALSIKWNDTLNMWQYRPGGNGTGSAGPQGFTFYDDPLLVAGNSNITTHRVLSPVAGLQGPVISEGKNQTWEVVWTHRAGSANPYQIIHFPWPTTGSAYPWVQIKVEASHTGGWTEVDVVGYYYNTYWHGYRNVSRREHGNTYRFGTITCDFLHDTAGVNGQGFAIALSHSGGNWDANQVLRITATLRLHTGTPDRGRIMDPANWWATGAASIPPSGFEVSATSVEDTVLDPAVSTALGDYLPLTGGTVTGDLAVGGNVTFDADLTIGNTNAGGMLRFGAGNPAFTLYGNSGNLYLGRDTRPSAWDDGANRYATAIGYQVGWTNWTGNSHATLVGYRADSTAAGATYVTALGSNAKAGPRGVAIGYNAVGSTGDYSVVMGFNSKATGAYGVAIGGYLAEALGGSAVALGHGAKVAENTTYGIAIGRSAVVEEEAGGAVRYGGLAIGYSSLVDANHGTAIGYDAHVEAGAGAYSVALGSQAKITQADHGVGTHIQIGHPTYNYNTVRFGKQSINTGDTGWRSLPGFRTPGSNTGWYINNSLAYFQGRRVGHLVTIRFQLLRNWSALSSDVADFNDASGFASPLLCRAWAIVRANDSPYYHGTVWTRSTGAGTSTINIAAMASDIATGPPTGGVAFPVGSVVNGELTYVVDSDFPDPSNWPGTPL